MPRGASYSPDCSGMGPQASSEARSAGRALFPQANRVTDTPNKNPGPQYNLTDAIGIQHESTRRNPGYVNFKNSSDRFPRLYPDVPGGLGPDSGNFKHKETPPSFTLATPCSNVWAPESCTPGPIYENDTAYVHDLYMDRCTLTQCADARWCGGVVVCVVVCVVVV